MTNPREITYSLDSCERQSERVIISSEKHGEITADGIPRVARLLALALRFEGLIRDGGIRDYAELARVGGVTRARITQIWNGWKTRRNCAETACCPLVQRLVFYGSV